MTIRVPSPPSKLEPAPNIDILDASVPLHRIWNKKFAANTFNPGKGDLTRFAPINTAKGEVIPTLYAGSSQECAYHERLFHDVPLEGPLRNFPLNKLTDLMYGTVVPTRPLKVAKLFRPDLALWGITREQLVHTDADAYIMTARWAEAIHRDYSQVEGLVWTSHRCDPDLAFVFFGDRIGESELAPAGPARSFATDLALLDDLRGYAQRAGILLISS